MIWAIVLVAWLLVSILLGLGLGKMFKVLSQAPPDPPNRAARCEAAGALTPPAAESPARSGDEPVSAPLADNPYAEVDG